MFFSSLRFFCFPSACAPRHPPPLQACKPNHSAEGGGSGQSLPPHVGSLGQAEDQSCPAKRRRASSPSKVKTRVTTWLNYQLSSYSAAHLHSCVFNYTVYSLYLTNDLNFQLSCALRVIHGPVTLHSSQFPTGISPHRNYRSVMSLISYLTLFMISALNELWVFAAVCLQLLEQLRSNRASLKPPQLQMLGQLEAQFTMMQQHQHQVKSKTTPPIDACTTRLS